MNHLNNELYNYYTKPENISSVINIYRDFPLLQEQLIEDFWKNVYTEIQTIVDEKEWHLFFYSMGEEFEIAITPKSMLYEVEKSACWLSYWDHGTVKRKEYVLRLWVYEKIKIDYGRIIKESKVYEKQGWSLSKVSKDEEDILIQQIEQDFNDPNLLESIIPSSRSHLVTEFAKKIADAAKILKPLMLIVNKSKK